ncbi:hypothetical protein C6501_19325 [Candidatus Poribacteria bacterium]|nr:MAG: hypothetical protein C6501_19325 [Candidatus Poribacteria bacterium]
MLDAIGIADKLLVYKAHVDNANLALGDWALQQLENAVKFKLIPIHHRMYARLCQFAGARDNACTVLSIG